MFFCLMFLTVYFYKNNIKKEVEILLIYEIYSHKTVYYLSSSLWICKVDWPLALSCCLKCP